VRAWEGERVRESEGERGREREGERGRGRERERSSAQPLKRTTLHIPPMHINYYPTYEVQWIAHTWWLITSSGEAVAWNVQLTMIHFIPLIWHNVLNSYPHAVGTSKHVQLISSQPYLAWCIPHRPSTHSTVAFHTQTLFWKGGINKLTAISSHDAFHIAHLHILRLHFILKHYFEREE